MRIALKVLLVIAWFGLMTANALLFPTIGWWNVLTATIIGFVCGVVWAMIDELEQEKK